MDPAPALQSQGSPLAQPRPVRPQRGPRLDADLRAAAPVRVRRGDRRSQEVQAAALEDAWPSRVPRHPRRRGDHRTARAGHRQRRGHGALAEDARRARRRGADRQLRLRHLLRRRPDGRRLGGSFVPGGFPETRQPDLPLRRQPRLARRPYRRDVHRGPARAVRGVRLAHPAGRGRQRHGGDRPRDPRGEGREGSSQPDRGAHGDRLRLAQQGRHARGARLAPGEGRGQADQAEAGMAPGADLPGPRRGARPVGRARRGAEEGLRRLAAEARAMAQGPGPRAAVGPVRQSRGAARSPRAARQGRREHGRAGGDPQGVAGGHPEGGGAGAQPGGRLRRSRPLDVHVPQGRRRREAGRVRRPQHPLRGPRARHGRDGERLRLRRVLHPVRRDVPPLQRLHAAPHPAGGAVEAAEPVRLHARLDLPRGGRAHPPAHRAARLAARHPAPPGLEARRSAGGGRLLGRGAAAQGGADRAGAHPAEAAAAAARDRGRRAEDPARRLHPGGGAGRARAGDRGHRVGAAGLAAGPPVPRRRAARAHAPGLDALRGALPRVARAGSTGTA